MYMEEPRSRQWIWVLAAMGAGLALRMYFVLHAPGTAGDALVYGDIARNLIQHHVYGFSVPGSLPRPTLIRLPGYPLFLAVCFLIFGMENYQAVLHIQVVLDLLTCLLIAGLARRLFDDRAGIAALWCAVLCPFTANYVSVALTETLTLLTIATAFYAVERWHAAGFGYGRWLWVISGALSWSILLRPEQGLLAAAVLPAMLWTAWISTSPASTGSRVRVLVPVFAAAFCIVFPLVAWAYRNQRTFNVFQPLAPRFANDPGETVPLGFQRWYRTWGVEFISTETVYWNYDGSEINIADLPNRAFDDQSQYTRVEQLLAQYNLKDSASPELDHSFDELASERVAANPIRYYLALPVARLANMLLRPRTEFMPLPLDWWKWSLHPAQTAFSAAYATLNLTYLAAGCFGFALWKHHRFTHHAPLAWSMAAYVILRCALLLTIDNSEPRYTLEFFPILSVWISARFADKRYTRMNSV